jgi:protein-disulfide isomerase
MKNGEWYPRLARSLLVLCAVILTGLALRREFFAPEPQPKRQLVSDWPRYAAHGQRIGGTGLPVTVVVFSDFQCPACRLLADNLETVRKKHPRQIGVVYRHYPLPNHPHAASAARASECAGRQGRFEAYHNALFQEQTSIGDTSWIRFAMRAQVPDSAAFSECMGDSRMSAAVERDLRDAEQLGVMGTPTLLINGVRLDGAPKLNVLEAYVRRALDD